MADDDRRSVGVRVRPNSHDFIRQLRQQLATKKYTFYVDVQANMNPATRDVRTWANSTLKKIHASVEVKANTGPATRDMADWRRRQAGISTTVKVKADTSSAVREIEMLNAAARDITVRVKADVDRAKRTMQTRANVRADTSALKRDIQEAVQQEGLFTIEPGINKAKAKAKITEFFDEVKGTQGELDLDLDTLKARAQLKELQAEVAKKQSLNLELDPRFDYRLRQRLRGIKKPKVGIELALDEKFDFDLQKKLRQIEASEKAKIKTPLELEVDAAERRLMAFKITEKAKKLGLPVEFDPTDIKQMRLQLQKLRFLEEANSIKLKVEVGRGGFERVKRQMDQFSRQFGNFSLIRSLDVGPFNLGKPTGLIGTLSTLTILAGLLPGVTAGALALSDALIRVAGAAALAPGAIGALAASLGTLVVGSKGLGDAFSSLFEMWDEGASQQQKSATRLVKAQNDYRQAVYDEGRAQERVAQARRQALGELRNLNNELRGGVLNEAQALLDLQKARDRYAQGGFENETERLQAQLDIQRAELQVSNVREDNISLQQKANEANAKGVEGSDAVRDALEAQRQAAERTAAATEALAAGGVGATTAAQKFQDQLAQLSPNAQDFVMTVAGMKDEMLEFRNALQDTIFQGAGPAFREMFNNLMPVIGPGMQQIAQGLNQNLLQVFDSLQSPDGQTIIERILGGTAETQKAITGMINPLIQGVGTLVAAGTEKMPQLIGLITTLLQRFQIFIEEADRNGSLDKFLDKGIGALADMVEIGLNLIQIVNDLSEAFGGDILKDIKNITDSWHEFLSSDEGQLKLKTFLLEARELWAKWKPVIMEIPDAFAALSNAANRVLGFLLPTIEKILGFLNKFPGAIELIATALITSKLLGSFSTLARTVGGIFSMVKSLPGMIRNIPPVPGAPGAPGAPVAGGVGGGLLAPTLGALAVPAVLGSYSAGLAADAGVGGTGQLAAAGAAAGLTYAGPLAPVLPVLLHDRDFALNTFGSADENARKKLLDAIWKKFEERGKKDEDAQKLYGPGASGKMPREQLERIALALAGTPSFMTGGYTDWGRTTGKTAELHGNEYVQPSPVVSHYGLDAMKAVHEKKAVISFDKGGMMPSGVVITPWGPMAPNIGGGLGSYTPGEHGFIPGASEGIGGHRSPFWGKIKRPRDSSRLAPEGPDWGFGRPGHGIRGVSMPSFEGGGLVYDPNTGTYVQEGAAVTHGQNPKAAGPGIIDSITSGVVQGAASAANAVSAALPSGGTTDAAVSPFGVTGLAPGPATPTGGTSPFLGGLLGSLGIPGLSGDTTTQSGPGWGPGGPPVGLGGGPDGFDIRRFGIGPGPVGSGPNDWLKFTGSTLGTFGSSLVNTFMGGILGGLGLSGLSSYIQTGGKVADHFATAGTDTKVQGPGAAQTNADVSSLLDTELSMPTNPAYPGFNVLPAPFDPATGSAVGSKLGGLQPATARGEAAIRARFPWATNIGGVRPDSLKWHPNGLALDVMTDPGLSNNASTPQGLAKGDQLYAWLQQNKQALGIDYILWRKPDHWNHVHVNFAPSGPQGAGALPPVSTTTPNPAASGGWGMTAGTPAGKTYPALTATGQPSTAALKGLPTHPGSSMTPPGAPKQAPGAQPGPPKKVAPPGTPLGDLFLGTFDKGGWVMPGTTIVHNATNKPELITPIHSFAAGGLNTGLFVKPVPPIPRPPDVIKMQPKPPPPVAPKPAVPAIPPPEPPPVAAPPVTHGGTGAPPGPATAPPPQGPGGGPIQLGPVRPATGVGPGEGKHVHPALEKGITSGFATAGNLAATAISLGAAAATGGAAGGGGGGMGGFIQGLFGQAGKIANNVANVASSFLVGNITGGTTENPYGVTQRGNVPTGGTRVVDASNNQYGDVYTNNLDEYFTRVDRRNAQRAQSSLGRWGTQV